MFALMLFAAAAADAAPAPANPDNVVRCVRENITGSLMSTRRVCHTEREWKQIRADANDEAQRMFERGLIRRAGGSGG